MMPDSIDDLSKEITAKLARVSKKNTANIRGVRRAFSRRLATAPGDFVFDLAMRIITEGVAPRFFAYELVQHHHEASRSLNSSRLMQLGKGLDSWGDVDAFGCYMSGPAWRERRIPNSLIEAWAHSKNRWWRRAALVSTVPLNNRARGGTGDVGRTLQICSLLVRDRDDMVVKALSWALRELAKRDSNSVEAFLAHHELALPPRVLREVRNKIRTGLKNPRLGRKA
jgi:3-methyladenine DNA glycosylase AlkD